MALPFLPGGHELAKRFTDENDNTTEHDEFYKIAGVTREHVWIQRSPPESGAPDLQVERIETEDHADMLKEFATSNHPWAIKFRKFFKGGFGIDLSMAPPPPSNELIVDWTVSS